MNVQELRSEFTHASEYVKAIVPKLTSQQMLKFYGFYKQATEGRCTKPAPRWYEITEKQKWEAWSGLKNLDSETAMLMYVNLLDSMEPEWRNKTEKKPGAWVHHSCMQDEDEKIEDCNKTIFDWVKENNLDRVKKCATEVMPEIDKLDENGLSLLHWATDRGNLEIVKYLIENLKGDINVKDENGQTPLHYAVSCEYEDIVRYLVEAGADVNETDNDGLNPYDANK